MNKLTVSTAFYLFLAILAYLLAAAQGLRVVNCFGSARAVIIFSLLMGAASTFLLSYAPNEKELEQ
jgi:hypothetical protein